MDLHLDQATASSLGFFGFEVLGAATAGCVVAFGVTDGCVSPQAEIGLKTQEAFVWMVEP